MCLFELLELSLGQVDHLQIIFKLVQFYLPSYPI